MKNQKPLNEILAERAASNERIQRAKSMSRDEKRGVAVESLTKRLLDHGVATGDSQMTEQKARRKAQEIAERRNNEMDRK